MLALFEYGFMLRGMAAGIIVGAIAPLIGIFLVLRRYSLIADTLAHVALAGVALGLLFGAPPLATGIATAAVSSIAVERLRTSRRVSSDAALSMFLSGSLALAVVLISVGGGFSVDLFSFLFGSIVTVQPLDLVLIGAVGLGVLATIIVLFRELVAVTFDEESAQVSGIRTRRVNTILILLAALTVSLSIPIVGTLLIAALVVIPVVTALQLHRGFLATILVAEGISVASVLVGITSSFYLDIPAGATIVLLTIVCFIVTVLFTRRSA